MKARKLASKVPGAFTHRWTMSEGEYVSLSENGGGLCYACGAEAEGVEPDARKYTCASCGEPRVSGVEEILIAGHLELDA